MFEMLKQIFKMLELMFEFSTKSILTFPLAARCKLIFEKNRLRTVKDEENTL